MKSARQALVALIQWADKAPGERMFNVRYLPGAAPSPWAVDLENHATQAAVHVECHESLVRATLDALGEAAEDEAM